MFDERFSHACWTIGVIAFLLFAGFGVKSCSDLALREETMEHKTMQICLQRSSPTECVFAFERNAPSS